MYAYFYKIKKKLMLVFQDPVGLNAKGYICDDERCRLQQLGPLL